MEPTGSDQYLRGTAKYWPLVQLLGCHEVLQVLVIHPDFALVFCALDEVLPLLEGSDDC